jgi:UDP-3-O-[3-hydroxymyristoyl] glucosamine N-acyltransferase
MIVNSTAFVMKFSEIGEKLSSSVVAHSLTLDSNGDPEIEGRCSDRRRDSQHDQLCRSNKFAVC